MNSMFKEIVANEYWLPYAELILLSLWWINTSYIESMLSTLGVPHASIVVGVFGVVLLIVLLVSSARHDQSLENHPLDEREARHELEVSSVAYHVAFFGLGAYLLFWTFDPILLGLLALILASRLYKRVQVERI